MKKAAEKLLIEFNEIDFIEKLIEQCDRETNFERVKKITLQNNNGLGFISLSETELKMTLLCKGPNAVLTSLLIGKEEWKQLFEYELRPGYSTDNHQVRSAHAVYVSGKYKWFEKRFPSSKYIEFEMNSKYLYSAIKEALEFVGDRF